MDSLPYGMFKTEIGKDSYYRELVANSDQLGQGTLLYAMEAKYYNGPWQYPENSRQFKGILRYTMGDDSDGMRVTGIGYSAVGRTNDAIPLAEIEAGQISRYGSQNPFEGLSTQRFQMNTQWWHRDDEGDLTKANLYGVYYGFSYFFAETGDFLDPVNGDLTREFEHNMTFGGNLEQSWNSRLFGDCVRDTVGIQVRNDNIPHIGDEHVINRNLLNILDEASILESNVGVYYNSDVKWGEKVRTELGVRVDYFHWHVDDFVLPANDGHTEAKLIEPKGSLILGPWQETVFYLNGGYGFHSNDARGIFATESAPLVPISEGGTISTGNMQASPIARTRGAEIGMKTQAIPNLTTTVAFWYLRMQSELVYDAFEGDSSPRGTSERYGIELSNTYRLNGWLTFDLDWAASQAHFLSIDQMDNGQADGNGAGGYDVPQAVGVIVSGGPTVRLPNGCFGSLRYRYIGPRDLSSDGLISSHATNEFDLGMGYECLRYTIGLNILNLTNANGVDDAFAGPGGYLGPNGPKYANTEIIHPLTPFQARFYFNLKF